MRLFFLLLIVPFILAGCVSKNAVSTHHTRQQVIQIASTFVRSSGWNLNVFLTPKAEFDPQRGDWWIKFTEKPPEHAGGDIIVSVDDASGATRFVPRR